MIYVKGEWEGVRGSPDHRRQELPMWPRMGGGARARSSRQAGRWLGSSQGCLPPGDRELSRSPGPSVPSGREPLGPDSRPLASPAPMPAPSPSCGASGSESPGLPEPLQILLGLCFLRQLQEGPGCGQQNSASKAVHDLIPRTWDSVTPHGNTSCPRASVKDLS